MSRSRFGLALVLVLGTVAAADAVAGPAVLDRKSVV